MAELGNARINQIYEAVVSDSLTRPAHNSPRSVREAWIKAKYVEKAFVRHTTQRSEQPPDSLGRSGSKAAPPARRWSVYKRKRKSPAREKVTALSSGVDLSSLDDAESASMVKDDADSGLDVIVFGADVNSDEACSQQIIPLADELSGDSDADSVSDTETDADVRSTTSLEDISKLTANMLLYKAARARNLAVMSEALAQSANINWTNVDDGGRTPLIQAIHSGSMTTVEFLLLNGAKVDIRDSNGQGPLHHATLLGNSGQGCQLLKRSANQHAVDDQGQDPLSIAVKNANADIVTILRLAKLNEEMKESDYGVQDDTVNEVFRDFTNMASSSQERLNRSK
jgi:Arf-GAP/coiled-coil/ANK repeat/PH domain-containing protein